MSTTPDQPTPAPPRRDLGPTTPIQAVVAALAGAVVAYFLIATMMWRHSPVPVTPWSLALVVAAFAVAAGVYSTVLRRQVATDRQSITPEVGVRALVLGKTLLMTGAVLAGGHAVYLSTWLGQMDAPLPHQRVVHGAVMIVVSLLCALAGHWLERACMVPPGDEDPNQDTPSGGR